MVRKCSKLSIACQEQRQIYPYLPYSIMKHFLHFKPMYAFAIVDTGIKRSLQLDIPIYIVLYVRHVL